MKTIKRWFLYSSANPQKVALTVKAGVPLLLTILTSFGLSFTDVDVQDLTGIIGDFVFNSIQVISLIGTVYGLGRKIVLTFHK